MATATKTKTTVPAPTAAPAAPVKQRGGEERNGIRRPSRDGTVAMMWLTLDSAPHVLSGPELTELAEQMGWNTNLLRSHARQWRKWHGVEAAAKPAKAAKPDNKPEPSATAKPASSSKRSKGASASAATAPTQH